MRFGKLSAEELQKYVLDKLSYSRSEVVLSAAQGEDCAAVKTNEFVLLSSDPITAAMSADKLGELAVSVCCNDIVACGGEPFALMLTVIVPPDASESDIEQIMAAASAKAASANVAIIGGHTEFSDCVTRPIVSGTAIGKTERLVKKTSLKVGDKLYVTKTLGMEGTTIIVDGGKESLSQTEKSLCETYRKQLSVEKEGRILRDSPFVSIMHDITEGGVIGAVAEVCLGCGKGALMYEKAFPVSDFTKRLCNKYEINPARLISSGSMLFAANDAEPVEKLIAAGIEVSEIGVITDGEVLLVGIDGMETVVKPESDEMYKYFERCGL